MHPAHDHDDHDHDHDGHEHDGHEHDGHEHDHGPPVSGRVGVFVAAAALNLAFVAVEAGFGVAARSMALLADAAHNLGDVAGLALAGTAAWLAGRRASGRRSYGFRRSTILAAVANAVLLLVAVTAVLVEALGRLRDPVAVRAPTVMAVAAAGVLVNGVSALLFARSRGRDVNVRAAFLHLAADAAISVAVVLSGALVAATGRAWIDPVASIVVSLFLAVGALKVLRTSLDLALDAAPEHVDLAALRAYLLALPGVCGLHDLHVWATSTTDVALTAHLEMPGGACPPEFQRALADALRERFDIGHATVQIDPAEAAVPCALAPCAPTGAPPAA